MAKRKADAALTGLLGAYGSDDEGASGEGADSGGGVVLLDLEDHEQPSGDVGQVSSRQAAAGLDSREAEREAGRDEMGTAEDSAVLDRRTAVHAQLPPELAESPQGSCDPAVQDKVRDYLRIQREQGKFINAELRRSRGYRNPDFLQKMVDHFQIEELGTAFPPHLFDPKALHKEDYYDELAREWQRLDEQRRSERAKSGRVDFVKSGSQPDLHSNPLLSGSATTMASQLAAKAQAQAQLLAASAGAAGKRSKWDAVPRR